MGYLDKVFQDGKITIAITQQIEEGSDCRKHKHFFINVLLRSVMWSSCTFRTVPVSNRGMWWTNTHAPWIHGANTLLHADLAQPVSDVFQKTSLSVRSSQYLQINTEVKYSNIYNIQKYAHCTFWIFSTIRHLTVKHSKWTKFKPAVHCKPKAKTTVAVLGHFRRSGCATGKEDSHGVLAPGIHANMLIWHRSKTQT